MNLIVGFVILLCLYGSTRQADSQPQDLVLQLLGIGLTAISVPGLAFVQTMLVNRRMAAEPLSDPDFELIQSRIDFCHTAVWLTASIGMIWAFRWHDVVHQTLGLEHWVLIDEALILAPAILALVASWAVFFEIESSRYRSGHLQRLTKKKKKTPVSQRVWAWITESRRFHFVSIRFGIHVAVVLIPMLGVIAAKDLLVLLDSVSPPFAYPLGAAMLFSLLLLFPLMIRLAWNTSPTAPDLLASIKLELAGQGVRVNGIRIWNTQNQVINACVVGFLPWLRQILISDRLVQLFPEPELKAIFRHEAAHLRRRHALTRIAMMLLPLALWMMWSQLFHNQALSLSPMAHRFEVSPLAAGCCLATLYGIYLACLQRHLGHTAEYEADLLACCVAPNQKTPHNETPHNETPSTHPNGNAPSPLTPCPLNHASMLEALLRLGACFPHHVDRDSWMHPSIRNRIKAIQGIAPDDGKQGPVRSPGESVEAVFRFHNIALATICGVVILATAALAY